MNRTPTRQRTWLAAVLTALFLPALVSANNDKKIDVSVTQDGSGNYVLSFDNDECPARWREKKGCVLQRKGNSGKIEWRLDAASVSEGWTLVALYFGTQEKQRGVVGSPLLGCLVADFGFDRNDAATGLVREAKPKSGGKALELKNNTQCGTEYFIYYTLEGIRTDGTPAESDPIISNGGRPGRGGD